MSNEERLADFCAATGADSEVAHEYLAAHNWDAQLAASAFLADQEDEPAAGVSPARPTVEVATDYTGPRTLDGRPAPQYASSTSASAAGKKPEKRKGLATLSSIGGSSSAHDHDHDDDDDDDDDDEKKGPRDLFAGGEKSGLAVQDPAQRSMNPKKLVDDIIAKAMANAQRGESSGDTVPAGPVAPRSSHFAGTGQTLGGDGVESRVIPGAQRPAAPAADDETVHERILHLWRDGFSIDDGPLHRFDDPANRQDLAMIRAGRAPLHLMNVRPDQRVDVKLQQHEENWKQPPKIYRPFGGDGHRLGSPVPGDGNSSSALTLTTTATSSSATAPAAVVDESQPTLMLRIQLPNGTRLPARFNTTHTVGDVYEFVSRAWSPLKEGRPWVISTTFPNKDHTDRDSMLGDMQEFKKGGTAVVKWT